MSTFGLHEAGFTPKTLHDLKTELEADLRATLGPEINLLPSSVLGQVVGIFAAKLSELWDAAQAVYRSQYPDSADGEALDNVASITGVVRLPPTKSRVAVMAHGRPGTSLAPGRLLRVSGTARQFRTVANATIGDDGTVRVETEALEYGPVQTLAGTLTEIETPVGGWLSVTNPEDAELGRLAETDDELRRRRERLLRSAGAGTLDALAADIHRLADVQAVRLFENLAGVPDDSGLPPHSFEPVVIGGDDAAIAQAIWNAKPVGIATHGDVAQQVRDSTGRAHIVRFSRPEVVHVAVAMKLDTDDRWPDNGRELVANALERCNERFVLGQDAIASQLYAAVHSVPGVFSIEEILLAKKHAGTPGAYGSVVPISPRQIARYDTDYTDVPYAAPPVTPRG